jgi:hypothetical protein
MYTSVVIIGIPPFKGRDTTGFRVVHFSLPYLVHYSITSDTETAGGSNPGPLAKKEEEQA